MAVMENFSPAPARGLPGLRTLSDFSMERVDWLMLGRIPYARVTLLGGKPGEGKSTLTMALAAEVTRKRMGVVYVGSEDDPASDIRPRLLAAGGDDTRFHLLGGDNDASFPEDVDLLERAVVDTGAGLVIIDPIMAHLSAGLNPNDDHSVRQGLRPLVHMARRTKAAVVLVAHRRKGSDGSPLDWFGGATGFGGLARSALIFGTTRQDADSLQDDDRRYLIHAKSNGSALRAPLTCHLQSASVTLGDETYGTLKLAFGHEDQAVRAQDLR